MPTPIFRRPTPPWPVTAMVAGAVVLTLCVIDTVTGPAVNIAILMTVALAIAAYGRNVKLLWAVAAAAVVATIVPVLFKLDRDNPLFWFRVLNRTLVVVALVLVTWLLQVFVKTYHLLAERRAELQRQHESLEQSHAELSAREEEIARQNEELQNQTEELERQGEELRLTNDELARREKMLEALLSLSRTLASSPNRSETMDKICQTLGELINGPQTAVAILERQRDEMRIVCRHGFGDAIMNEVIPFRSSFAALVLERNRTGYLEDVELRPELVLPQPRSGPKMRSVLAAPLRVGGRAVGSLEVYHADRHAWTDEQITLIESLAAQTSISLEAAELFERIEDERRRLSTVLETVPFGIMMSNHDCSEVRLNAAGAAMLNVPADTRLDFAQQQARWKIYQAGRQVPPDEQPIARACLHGQVVHNDEIELLFASGRRVNVLMSAAPVRDREGGIIGAVAGWADVSQLTTLQKELDARRREAEESSARKSRFLAAVSHDIRTPANAISLLAELMQRTATTPGMIGEIPEIAVDLKRSALTLVDLVSDVLDLTRFDSGKLELQESVVSLDELMNEECRQLQQTAREKGLEFECNPPGKPITIRTDRVKLSRILTNLISNAIKFTERGKITINVGRTPDGSAAIRVRDTGCGIAREHFDRIFDEFFQLKNSDRDRSKGSGLGLAICRRLAEAMGGTITVESELGHGSEFTVILPATSVIPA